MEARYWLALLAAALGTLLVVHITDRVIAGLTANPCEINMPEGD